MASNKKTQKATDNKPEIEEEIDGPQTSDEAQAGVEDSDGANSGADDETNAIANEPAEANQNHKVIVKVDADEAIKTIHRHIASNGNLHARIEKTARSLSTHGGQERVHAINQVELLTGRLKMVLPAAITATDDAELQAALETLLGLL